MFDHDNENLSAQNNDVTIHAVPRVIPDTNVANSMIARELNETSTEEREKAYEDIHGVSKEIIEEPEFVSKCLNEMQAAVDGIRNKPAYEMALAKSAQYAAGRSTYLMFLRSTDFNPKRAATKIVKYFEHIRHYFGDEVLGRPIQYSDMNKDDLECLKSGWLQMLPFRDKSGRIVLCSFVRSLPDRKAVNVIRAILYASMMLVNDEDMQKRGIVTATMGGQGRKITPNLIDATWHVAILMSYVPLKIAAMHVCIEKARTATPLLSIAAYGWGKDNRIRHRVHFGTQTEWLYSLMTFGIPVDYIPLTISGELKTKYYREWLSQMRTLEENRLNGNPLDTNNVIIMIPRWTDVLGGRGSVAQTYVGNVLFNQEVDEFREQYQKESSRKKKLQIVAQIHALMEKENVRFLERDKYGFWIEVCDAKAIRDRIMIRLRSKSKTTKPAPRVEHEEDEDNPPPSFLNQTGKSERACCRPSHDDEKEKEGGQNKRPRL